MTMATKVLTTLSFEAKKVQKTTRRLLQSPRDTPLISGSDAESFNATRKNFVSNVNSPDTASKQSSRCGSGCNAQESRSLSPKHSVFVLAVNNKPLTPTTPCRASKLMRAKQAVPVWNKFGKFGIQMLVETRKFVPKTVLSCDFGTKFEGYSIVSGENNFNAMWKLPDKKKIVAKLEERRQLRRARRQRSCRRRECRFDNRGKKGFIAPSQRVMVDSRLKAIRELLKCYPITNVAIEDVSFNHRDKRWGANFSTVEIGKQFITDFVSNKVGTGNVSFFKGHETKEFREELGLKKSSNKSAEHFYSHCVDSYVMGAKITGCTEPNPDITVVDDTYRCVRRKLHKTQPQKGGIRRKESQGNFLSIRKGSLCNFGLVGGGTGKTVYIYPLDKPVDKKNRIGRAFGKVLWLSHNFKVAIPPTNKFVGFLATES